MPASPLKVKENIAASIADCQETGEREVLGGCD